MASRILGNQVRTAEITLYGSFAQTGKGHGTDKAIIAGLLGFAPDDLRIRNAYQEARKRGMEVQMVLSTQEMPHPNTARIRAEGANGLRIDMVGVSLGGAVIEVRQLNGMDVAFRCEYPTPYWLSSMQQQFTASRLQFKIPTWFLCAMPATGTDSNMI